MLTSLSALLTSISEVSYCALPFPAPNWPDLTLQVLILMVVVCVRKTVNREEVSVAAFSASEMEAAATCSSKFKPFVRKVILLSRARFL